MILWKDYFPKYIYFLKILIPKYLLKIVLFNKIPPVLDFDLLIFFFILFPQETYKSVEIIFLLFFWSDLKSTLKYLCHFSSYKKIGVLVTYKKIVGTMSFFFFLGLKVLIIHFVHHNSNSKLHGGQPSNLHPWPP